MNLIACKIHNNSLGKTISVNSFDEGKALLRQWAEEQFERSLTNEENDSLENEMEIYNDNDFDNIYSFSIGIVEEYVKE